MSTGLPCNFANESVLMLKFIPKALFTVRKIKSSTDFSPLEIVTPVASNFRVLVLYFISTPILFVIGGLLSNNNSVFKFNCIILPNFIRYLFAEVFEAYPAGTSQSTLRFDTSMEASRFCSIAGIVA